MVERMRDLNRKFRILCTYLLVSRIILCHAIPIWLLVLPFEIQIPTSLYKVANCCFVFFFIKRKCSNNPYNNPSYFISYAIHRDIPYNYCITCKVENV